MADGLKAVVPWVTLADSAPDTVPNAAALKRFAAGFGGAAEPAVGYGVDAVSLAHAMSPANHAGPDRKALVTAVMQDGVWKARP